MSENVPQGKGISRIRYGNQSDERQFISRPHTLPSIICLTIFCKKLYTQRCLPNYPYQNTPQLGQLEVNITERIQFQSEQKKCHSLSITSLVSSTASSSQIQQSLTESPKTNSSLMTGWSKLRGLCQKRSSKLMPTCPKCQHVQNANMSLITVMFCPRIEQDRRDGEFVISKPLHDYQPQQFTQGG